MGITSNGNERPGGDLSARRRAAGLSQERLAQLAECSTSAVQLFERGYRPGRSHVLERIETVLASRARAQ